MNRRVFVGVLCTMMLLAGAPGVTASYAAGEQATLTVALDDVCFEGQVSPDSTYFVCTGDNDSVYGHELYSVPIDGGAPATTLSDPSPPTPFPGHGVQWFDITPDGSTVVYAQGPMDYPDGTESMTLYSVPIAGGVPLMLTPDPGGTEVIWFPEITPDGSRVVFWWLPDEERAGLYSVDPAGQNLTLLHSLADGAPTMFVSGMTSPDSSRVLFFLHSGSPGVDAYSVPVTGGTAVQLTPQPVDIGPSTTGWITPDSAHYIYLADHDTAGVTELYTVPLSGGAATKLNRNLAAGESVDESVEVIPDSSGVLYSVAGDGEIPTWYRVPITGGTSIEISQAIGSVHVSADSSTVVLDNAFTTAYPLGGGPGVQLANRGSLLISPDSSTVWVWQNDGFDYLAQLYSVPIGGGDLRLHPGADAPTTSSDGYLDREVRMHVTPDSSRFVYAADTDGDGAKELMVVPANGGDAYQLAANVFIFATDESDLSGLFISPDSRRVVYQGDPFGTGVGFYSSLLTRYPEVSDSNWYAAEDAMVSLSVGVVDASDPDGDTVTFEIVDGGDLFNIDLGSGEVTLGAPLDHETAAEHQLVVEVSDGKVVSTALITIEVGNVNDNPPVTGDLIVTVTEDAPVGTMLGTVTGDDPDGDAVVFSLAETDALFSVDADGVVTLIRELDYDTATTHQFTVVVTDGVHTDTAIVTVKVTEVDDPPPSTTTTTVPPTTTPPPEFDDVPDTDLFHQDITWLATKGITKGCNPPVNDEFCPDDYVTRGQMAAFLHRALVNTLTAGPPVSFTDDDSSGFESDIEWLASVGVTKGCNPPQNTRYCPDDRVTRGQMAAFLDRALDLQDPTEGDLFVDDDDSPFEAQIDRLANAGITRGCNPPDNTLYCPDGYVTRAQMAAFLHRALGE